MKKNTSLNIQLPCYRWERTMKSLFEWYIIKPVSGESYVLVWNMYVFKYKWKIFEFSGQIDLSLRACQTRESKFRSWIDYGSLQQSQ